MADRGIEWRFIPPSAPHMGGAWERLVKSIKVALRATLKERAPKDEVLITLLAEAAHSVNSRPLTHVSLDPDDQEALTPNHFLIGQSSGSGDPGRNGTEERDLRAQWRKSQALANVFWTRWVKEYLPTLNKRSKWYRKMDPPKVGDFVFIGDGTLPRNSWPKGIITAIYPGKDGGIRVVDVRTSSGTIQRPIAKIMMPGSQLVDVGTLFPTSGGGMSPCLAVHIGEERGTAETPQPLAKRGGDSYPEPSRLGPRWTVAGTSEDDEYSPSCLALFSSDSDGEGTESVSSTRKNPGSFEKKRVHSCLPGQEEKGTFDQHHGRGSVHY